MAVLVGGDILNIAAAACAAVCALRMWGAPGLIPAAAVCALALYFLAGACRAASRASTASAWPWPPPAPCAC